MASALSSSTGKEVNVWPLFETMYLRFHLNESDGKKQRNVVCKKVQTDADAQIAGFVEVKYLIQFSTACLNFNVAKSPFNQGIFYQMVKETDNNNGLTKNVFPSSKLEGKT